MEISMQPAIGSLCLSIAALTDDLTRHPSRRSRRLRKKLHKHWLSAGVVDATQHTYWRDLLYKSDYYDSIPINKEHMQGLSKCVCLAIEKYNLQYLTAKIRPDEAESWLSDGGLVIFKFWAQEFPSVNIFSGNNPHVI